MIPVCLFCDVDRILVSDIVEDGRVIEYRPLGGGVELGEYTRGELGHEVVFVYDGESADRTLYERTTFEYSDGTDTIRARWMGIAELSTHAPLFLDGLLPLLTGRN